MHTIRVDTVRNRLYVTLVGFFSLEEIKKCGDEPIEPAALIQALSTTNQLNLGNYMIDFLKCISLASRARSLKPA